MQGRQLRRGHRRRSDRLPTEIPLRLTGAGSSSKSSRENSRTLTISRHGASVLSKQKFAPEQEIFVRRVDTGAEARARVAGKIADRAEGYVYAVEFVDPRFNLWETEFPSTADPDEASDRMFLVCGCCGKTEAVQFGEYKLGPFEVAHGVLLYCIQCQAMTRWKQRPEDAPLPA